MHSFLEFFGSSCEMSCPHHRPDYHVDLFEDGPEVPAVSVIVGELVLSNFIVPIPDCCQEVDQTIALSSPQLRVALIDLLNLGGGV